MTMAAVMDNATAAAQPGVQASRIARVDVLHDLAAAEPTWRRFEAAGHLSTPYQRFAFQSAWQSHIGAEDAQRPFIVIAYDADDEPLLLLPLVVRQRHGIGIGSYLGGKHVTFNMPLYQRDFAVNATDADIDALLRGIRAHRGGVDALALARQPARWTGIANPMALLPHQASTNDCPVLIMTPGAPPDQRMSNSFRKRLKGKERKYQDLPGFRYQVAASDADVTRVLDFFFATKPLRMAEQKLPDVFAEPGVEAFIRQACATKLAGGGRAIDIHALECDDEVIAMFAGVADDSRFSMMFNTYTMSANAKYSPGLILMRNIIDSYAGRGVGALDLGIGVDDYKRMFCKDDEDIFDSFVPLTGRGRAVALALSSLGHAKRFVKQSPALKQVAQKLRGVVQR